MGKKYEQFVKKGVNMVFKFIKNDLFGPSSSKTNNVGKDPFLLIRFIDTVWTKLFMWFKKMPLLSIYSEVLRTILLWILECSMEC